MKKCIAVFAVLLGWSSYTSLSSGLTAADRTPSSWSTASSSQIPTTKIVAQEDRVANLEKQFGQSQQRIADLEMQLAAQAGFFQGLQEHFSFDGNGNLEIEAMEIDLNAWAVLSVSSSAVDISAAQFSVDSSLADFAGVVRSGVVETESVISSSYTPGAGNIW